jgi:spermidine synthase
LIATLALFVTFTLFGLAIADLQIIDAAVLLAGTPDAASTLGGSLTELWLNVRAISLEVGVPAQLLGFAYPLGNATIQRTEHAVGRHAGMLYLANTVGAACGVLTAGFLLLPGVGMQATASILMIAGALAIVPLYLTTRASEPAARMNWFGTVSLAGVTLVGGLSIALWLFLPSNYLITRTTRQSNPNERLLTLSEGINEVVAITEIPGQGRQLLTDGHPMSFTSRMGQRYMHALADIPLLLVDKPESILVIGFGVGNTLYSTTLHPTVRRVEIADLSAQVLSHAGYFQATNHGVLSNPRVAVYVNDGRQHLRMQPPASYDVIALEPPPLALAGIGSLYSREFYALARTRLKAKGFLSQWLPVYQVPMATLQVMVRAFLDVFPNAVLLGGTDEELLLVGATDSRFEVDPNELARALAARPTVEADLQQLGLGTVREIVGTFVASHKTLEEASRGALAESDDRPMQEYSAASRLGWVHQDGVPAPLVDLSQVSTWCPRCFAGGNPIPLVDGLDAYLKLVEPLYKRMLPPTEGAGSVSDPQTKQLIEGSPYLKELLAFHASRLNGRGGVLASSGKLDDAIAMFRDGLRLNPESAEIYWNLGRALVARGGPMDEALGDLRRSVALDANQGPAHYDLASTLLDLHDVDGAIEHFREAIRLMPKSPEAHNNLGIALGTKGQLEDAIVQFQQAVQLNPDNAEAQHNLTSAMQAVGAQKP